MDWRIGMRMLAVVALVLLAVATILTKKPPATYGMKPKGEIIGGAAKGAPPRVWTVKEAFKTYVVWGSILAFFCSCFSEFLIWSQLVSYWVKDAGMSMGVSTNLYAFLGVLGCIFAPLLGTLSDKYAGRVGNETVARRRLMFVAPACGLLGMACLLLGIHSLAITILACVFFAMYWQGMPAQVTGYMGSVFGPSFPKIWGLATLIIMGIGPALGSYLGARLYVVFGSYRVSFIMALVMFGLSAFFALTLPKKIREMEQRSDG